MTVDLTCVSQQLPAFAAAAQAWLDAEPLIERVDFRPNGLTARIMPVKYGDGPLAGQYADDRARVTTLLRKHFPASLVESSNVDGVDWRQ